MSYILLSFSEELKAQMRMSVISIPVRSCGFPCKVSPRNSGSKQVWRPIRPTAALSSCSTAPRGQKVSPTASGGREPWTVNRGGAGGGCLAVWSGQSHRCAVEVSTFSRSSTCAAGGLGLLQLPWPVSLRSAQRSLWQDAHVSQSWPLPGKRGPCPAASVISNSLRPHGL